MQRSGGDARHAEVPFRQNWRIQKLSLVHPLDATLDASAGFLPDDEVAAEGLGQSSKRAVVRRRAEPAGEEHIRDFVIDQLASYLLDDLLGAVADRGEALDREAQKSQAF